MNLARLSAAATVLVAVASLLAWLGTHIAWSSDIRRLDRQQAQTAVEVYSKAMRDAVIMREAVKHDPTALKFIDHDLKDAKEKLQQSRQRLIDLSK